MQPAAPTPSLVAGLPARARTLFPGVLACAVVAASATFLSQHYGAPVMLFALILGIAMNFLSMEGVCKPGIEFTARHVLRWGVALLGLRITASQVVAPICAENASNPIAASSLSNPVISPK